MFYLYGSKPRVENKLAATFDSEQQLLAYVRWATLKTNPQNVRSCRLTTFFPT